MPIAALPDVPLLEDLRRALGASAAVQAARPMAHPERYLTPIGLDAGGFPFETNDGASPAPEGGGS